MNKKYLFLPLFFSVLCGTSFLNIVAVGLGETIAAGGAAYKMGKYAYDYVFNTEENKEIIKKHGPVAIYREGDLYPNFSYRLLSYWNESPDEFILNDSGIIEWPFNNKDISEKSINKI